ncbi:P-loop ATPase, Sll1717 family [Thioalkalivibrio thiocyanodenitrificans]|uniref:P-loop ATPase, Sll1717 family n=1 Tax=Thioalkalivibrio thiocyanodenitrificans TaxID=243063 RepID=UPI0003A60559
MAPFSQELEPPRYPGRFIGRRVFLTKSSEFEADDELINRIGIFDTLGYETYSQARELARLIANIRDLHPIDTTAKPNVTTPAYVLETPVRGGAMSHIISRIKKARLFYRSFIPAEAARLSAPEAISHVASSYGVVVPLLAPDQKDASVHNIRAAFVTGLSLGLELPTLVLQDQAAPLAPLDVRDFAKSYSRPEDLKDLIHEFSLSVFERIQETQNLDLPIGNLLSTLTVGDPMAENEFQTLGEYYLQTDEFNRALRGEVNLVVGRKGTGKTALFSQVRNRKRANKNNIVVDLKPEGYQLVKLKEDVLDFLSSGAKQHLVTALWEYLLYAEICHKVLEKDQERHLRDHRLYDGYEELAKLYREIAHVAEGDFSERLLTISASIVQEFMSRHKQETGTTLTTDEITGLIHAANIRELRESLSRYLRHKDEVLLLFDNLDKGWSSHGPATGDITILRCLIDAARKIQRQMNREGRDFHAIVFIRNDVYQLLMDETSDFGKETRADLDWRDPDTLRTMMLMRLVQNDFPKHATFGEVWNAICVSHIDGEETSQFMIERSLMRPRNFLKIFGASRGFAVNLQHDKIQAEDIKKGLIAYSNDLLIDADQELTDIEPKAARLMYQFLGEASEFSSDDLRILLDVNGLSREEIGHVIEFLLYYGFLGIRYADNDPQYIYDVGYNMEILKTRIQKNLNAITYTFNPAFWPALHIQH